MADKPKVDSKGQQELQNAADSIQSFETQLKSFHSDVAAMAPAIEDFEPQTKLSMREMASIGPEIMKPARSIGAKERFNETFRGEWEEKKKYVKCIVENYEIQGEMVELWTKGFPGVPCEFWQLPTNKPIAVPKYVAERVAGCKYHVLQMEDSVTQHTQNGKMYGTLVARNSRQRLDARPCGNAFATL